VTAAVDVGKTVAAALEALVIGAADGSEPAVLQLENYLRVCEQSITRTDALDVETAVQFRARLAIYRALVAAITRLSQRILDLNANTIAVSPRTGRVFLRAEQLEP
jgi:hypothetical protein